MDNRTLRHGLAQLSINLGVIFGSGYALWHWVWTPIMAQLNTCAEVNGMVHLYGVVLVSYAVLFVWSKIVKIILGSHQTKPHLTVLRKDAD